MLLRWKYFTFQVSCLGYRATSFSSGQLVLPEISRYRWNEEARLALEPATSAPLPLAVLVSTNVSTLLFWLLWITATIDIIPSLFYAVLQIMAETIMSKAATMEIPINSNGDTGTPEDDSLEQVGLSRFYH